MKIDITERLKAAAASGKTFTEQLAEARASGRPFGTVVDMKLGHHVIYHTDEEIAETLARAEEQTQERNTEAAKKAAMTVEEKLAAVGLTIADIKAAVAE